MQLLTRVRKALDHQQAGGQVFQPSAAERRVLEWLLYELGADMNIDRDPRYTSAYRLLDAQRPRLLEAILRPDTVLESASYPLDTGEVVELLRRGGLSRVDAAGTAVRRFADEFQVPQLGAGQRRSFFARHVLQIATAIQLDTTPADLETLERHLTDELTASELVLAPMLASLSHDRITSLARRSGSVLSRPAAR